MHNYSKVESARRHHNGASALALVIFVAGTTGIGYWYGKTRIADRVPNHGLYVTVDSLDFGEAWEQVEFPMKVRISNPTGSDYEIMNMIPSCRCTEIDPSRFLVPASGSAEVRLKLDLRPQPGEENHGPTRSFAASIVPVVRGQPPTAEGWVVRGTVRHGFAVGPQPIAFNEPLILGVPFPMIEVPIKTFVPINEFDVHVDSGAASAFVAPVEERPGGFKLLVTPAARKTPGEIEFDVKLRARPIRGGALPELPIRFIGRAYNDIQTVPAVLSFGMIETGSQAAEGVAVMSRSGRPLLEAVGEAENGSGIDVEDVRDRDANVRRFQLRVQRAAPGPHACRVRFRALTEGAEGWVAEDITVSYNGVAPAR